MSDRRSTSEPQDGAQAEWPEGYVITSRADMAAVLRQARMNRGMTCLELDHVAGFHDGYTGKLEHPDTKSGKRGLQLSFMAECWIEALGYQLVLIPREWTERLPIQRFDVARDAA